VVQVRETVDFGDLGRLTPFSDCWGFDRGQPVDRAYIEEFLAENAGLIKGDVLEVGEPLYTKMFGGVRVDASEVFEREAGPGVTYAGNLEASDALPVERFDCVIATQTFQFIYDVPTGVRSLHRALRPGGVLLATVPGITRMGDNAYPDSPFFWGFTSASVARLVGDVFGDANVVVSSYGNLLAATGFLYGLSASELARHDLAYRDSAYPVILAARAVKE
jgi:SAM-dependent methyltransferase